MSDPPIQGSTRFIAIDIHKNYLMIGGIDAQQRIVLQPRKGELHRYLTWASANLLPTDAVVLEAPPMIRWLAWSLAWWSCIQQRSG